MIGSTGDNLLVIIQCKYFHAHEWMSLLSWYSFHQNLPDATIVVAIERGIYERELYRWPYRVNANFFQFASDLDPLKIAAARGFTGEQSLVIPPEIVAIREFTSDEFLGPGSVQSEQPFATVNYWNGCGNFVGKDWINIDGTPFRNALKRFWKVGIGVNEIRVLNLFEKAGILYSII